MLSRRALIIAKAKYLYARELTPKEESLILRRIKVGKKKEFKDLAGDQRKNSFVTIQDIVPATDFNNKSHEELMEVMKDIAVRTSSVDSGLKMLHFAKDMTKEALLQYIFDLYLEDDRMREKYHKKVAWEGTPSILEPTQFQNVPNDPFVTPFHNPGQSGGDTRQHQEEYDKNGYLTKEFTSRDSQNEHGKKKKKPLKKYCIASESWIFLRI